jgi:ADP-ribose pyrophosphatase YjhB (NUDIX family)
MVVHPRLTEANQPVFINRPSLPTPLAAWLNPKTLACVVPDGPMPLELNGVPINSWIPPHDGWWVEEAKCNAIAEPPFKAPAGLKPAAGAVVIEPCGRIWLAQPTGGFGGVNHVVPKGRIDAGSSAASTAMREAWEEIGLRVRLFAWLVDLPRSTTFTRFYMAFRLGGTPREMGWESQGAVLTPAQQLPELLNGPHDAPLVAAILSLGVSLKPSTR